MDSIAQFFGAWGEPEADVRRAAISAAFAPAGTYADPMTPEPLVGPDAAAAYVSGFVEHAPGATATVIDSQTRHGCTRATIEFKMADGQVQYGQYFVEFDGASIARMVGFVGTGN